MSFPMPSERPYIRPVDNVWYGTADNKEALSVPDINLEYGTLRTKAKNLPFIIKDLSGALREAKRSAKSIVHNPYLGQKSASPEFFGRLDEYAGQLGVSDIGYTILRPLHMFKNSVALYRNAIVLTMEMKKDCIETAPSMKAFKEIFRTYHELGKAANRISEFLRESGYNAQPVPAIVNNINLTVLARDAGLGEFGKHGLLITEEFGPSVRLAAVLTDIENLPFYNGQHRSWTEKFCDSCNACVRACPAQAIYEKPIVLSDGSVQHIDYKKCAVPFSRQQGCTVCIRECTFFKKQLM